MLILGLTFVVLTMLGFGVVAIGAGLLNARLAARPALSAWLHKGAGAILVLLGLRLAWVEH
jgi:threonine/homoserine/homoserine lactone efflux protein